MHLGMYPITFGNPYERRIVAGAFFGVLNIASDDRIGAHSQHPGINRYHSDQAVRILNIGLHPQDYSRNQGATMRLGRQEGYTS